MKNILATAAAAFLLVTSTGCSGFLDEELKSSLSPDNTYTSSYGFEVGVNGLYGWARSEFNTWGGATTSQGQACPYESFQVATDIVYTGHGTVHWFLSKTCLIHHPQHLSLPIGTGDTV